MSKGNHRVRESIIHFARFGADRYDVTREVGIHCDVWDSVVLSEITKLVRSGKLEEKGTWIKSVPGMTKSRAGVTFTPFQTQIESSYER